jgi:prevent-host-death family protein
MRTHQTTVGIFDAKNHLSELIEKVGQGAEVIITRHDRPVARLVAVNSELLEKRIRATEELKRLRERYSLKGLSVRDLIEEGRK